MAKKRHHSSMPEHHKKHATHHMDEHMRRRHEMMDEGMIHEDKSEIANLPQNVMIKEYPRAYPSMPEDIDDTIRGVDEQLMADNRQRERGFGPPKM